MKGECFVEQRGCEEEQLCGHVVGDEARQWKPPPALELG